MKAQYNFLFLQRIREDTDGGDEMKKERFVINRNALKI
jgi:hypothetical protein